MIAMQYSFALPADYDMSIVDTRISEKGHLIDNFPNLLFKAYLSAEIGSDEYKSNENLYAPFYLWHKSAGMNDFLSGPGFAGLTQSFGWPSVKNWSVWQAEISKDIAGATFATREILETAPFSSIEEIRALDSESAIEDVEKRGALASVVAYEPTTWTRVRFRLWRELNDAEPSSSAQIYKVGYVSYSDKTA